jgi:hypothetical protein
VTDLSCPIDTCDFGADTSKTLSQVRSHINSMADDDHDWTDLEPLVEQQAETETSDEPDEEQDEPSESDTDDMGTDAEYQQQQKGTTETTGTEQESDEEQDEPSDSEGGPGLLGTVVGGGAGLIGTSAGVPLWAVGGAILVALLLVLLLSGDSDDDPTDHPDESVEQAEPADEEGSDTGEFQFEGDDERGGLK